jgi:hypothetical protein
MKAEGYRRPASTASAAVLFLLHVNAKAESTIRRKDEIRGKTAAALFVKWSTAESRAVPLRRPSAWFWRPPD